MPTFLLDIYQLPNRIMYLCTRKKGRRDDRMISYKQEISAKTEMVDRPS